MLVNHDQRLHYVYIAFTGVLLSMLLLLIYVSVQATTNERVRDDLRLVQRSLTFVKPTRQWQYQNVWRPIGHASKQHLVYSVYFDPRTDLLVEHDTEADEMPVGSLRIFAILPARFKDTISCHIRAEDFTTKVMKAQDVQLLADRSTDFESSFAIFSIMCPLNMKRNISTVRLPTTLALTYPSNRLSLVSPTFVPISYARDLERMLAKSRPVLAVCIGPANLHSASPLQVVEFIEMYRILGASHFYFYHVNASAEVRLVVEFYREQRIADLLDWSTPGHPDAVHEPHMAGIGVANECIYRAMVVDNYRYAALVDFDEILMPLKHNSLTDFLRQCDEGRTSAFVFRNVFFYRKDSNDPFSVPKHTRNRILYTQVKVRRTVEVMPAYTRTKCIVNTRSIREMGSHEVLRSMPGYADNVVHPSVGLLFHYRDKCLNCRALLIVDFTARRFGSLIWDRVDEACLHLFTAREGICPAS